MRGIFNDVYAIFFLIFFFINAHVADTYLDCLDM